MSPEPSTSLVPQPKVVAVGAGAGATVVVIFVASLFGVDMSPEVAASVVAVVAFLAGYLKSS